VNRDKFREKWTLELRDQPVREISKVRIASTRTARRAAYFDVHIPRFDRDAGSLRAREIVRVLKGLGFATTFLPEFPMDFDRYAEPLEREGIEVVDPRGPLNVPAFLQEVGPALDLVILSRPDVAARRAIEVRRMAPNATLLFDTVDLASLRERRRTEVTPDESDVAVAEMTADLELAMFRGADASVTVTELEARHVRAMVPDKPVFVWPTIHAVSHDVAPARGRRGLLFVGGFYHPPNADGIEWFLRESLPLLRERGIDDTVYVVGENAPPSLASADSADVRVVGWVPDLEPLYAQSRVFIAPLRFGAGIKGKVTDSLGHGLPVVTTPVGSEGIDTSTESGILVAEDAVAFADAVVSLCTDDDRWEAMSRAGVATIERSFSRAAVRSSIERGLVELGLLAPDVIPVDER
jgi:glycosyltransferase involved in cell wall biosynthesis